MASRAAKAHRSQLHRWVGGAQVVHVRMRTSPCIHLVVSSLCCSWCIMRLVVQMCRMVRPCWYLASRDIVRCCPPARGGKGGNEQLSLRFRLQTGHPIADTGVIHPWSVDLIEPNTERRRSVGTVGSASTRRRAPRSTGLFLALRGVNLKGARKQFCSKLRKDYICPQPVRRRAARARTCGTCLVRGGSQGARSRAASATTKSG